MHIPELAVFDLLDRAPRLRFGLMVQPVRAEIAVEELPQRRRQPRRCVHAIGDVPDRDFFLGPSGPQAAPHASRGVAVEI